MKNELKVKVLDALKEAQPTCFTKENVYKCGNDGMVCFNGMIAELINGPKYEIDDYYDRAYEMEQESTEEYLMEEVRQELHNKELWDDLSEEEQVRLEQEYFDRALENYEWEVSRDSVTSLVAEELAGDLERVYQSYNTLGFINETHYEWISGKIDFDLAMAEVERHIVENE